LYSRSEYARLEAFTDELEQMQVPDREPLLVMTAFFRAGATSARGQCRTGTEWWLKAISLCENLQDRSGFQAWIVDPETGIRANAVRSLFECGLIDQAREQSRRAVEMSAALGQPLAQSLAHWRAGMLEVRLSNPAGVMAHAQQMEQIVARTAVQQGDGPSRYLRGWAMAQLGQAREGVELIRDGLARHLRIGMAASSTEVMGYCVEALILAGDLNGARHELTQAFARARESGEDYYLPVLLMLQARVSQGEGDEAGAFQHLQEAVRTARDQGAAGFELKAANALVAHAGSTADDRRALQTLLGSFVEGRDTHDYRRGMSLVRIDKTIF
jgi:predicted ATPase